MPSWEWTLPAASLPTVADEARRLLAEVEARGPFLDLWLRTTARQLDDRDVTRVVVSYDSTERLLSFDAWVRDRRVYGADDYLG